MVYQATAERSLLSNYLACSSDKIDAVYEEDEKLLGHPRDPYHRVDTQRSSHEVRVLVDGEPIARTS